MKNQIILTALALGTFLVAQNQLQAQATTTVNITLADVISIDESLSSAAGGVVNFSYSTAEHYNSDQTVNVPTSLVVTSTSSFDIDVKANGENFTSGSDNIPVDVLTIQPVTGGTTTMTGTPSNVELSTTDQKLITGADLGSELVLELDYLIPAAKSSSSDILGKPAGTYTQTVTYTATAQ